MLYNKDALKGKGLIMGEKLNLTNEMPILSYSNEIRSAVLLVHGEKAHSCCFSKDAYKRLKGDNKELLIVSDAVHTDLYDKTEIIPFDKITEFINNAFNKESKA